MCCEPRRDGWPPDQHETGFRRSVIDHGPPLTSRGGGEPTPDMALVPRSRMDPPPRSFAADAHDCIMVPIPSDRPNTSLPRDRPRRWRAPLGSSYRHLQISVTARPVGMWTIGFADRLRFPRFPSKLEKRGNARLRPHTHRHHSQREKLISIGTLHAAPTCGLKEEVHVKSLDT